MKIYRNKFTLSSAFTILLLSACSGDTGSTLQPGESDAQPDQASNVQAVPANSSGSVLEDANNTDSSDEVTEPVPPDGTSSSDASSTDTTIATDTPSDTDTSNAGAAGTENPATVRVDFEITVPPYDSDELQVTVQVGDVTLNADWVSGELWTTSIELNQDTRYSYTVIFADKFGHLLLASYYDFIYPLGVDTLTVEIKNFRTDEGDNDNDGAPNYIEYEQGTDPLVPELMTLGISMMVPSFVSDSLGLVVLHRDSALSVEAQWVSGEQWYATLPQLKRGTNSLLITFYDRNGNVALASVETDFQEFGLSPELEVNADQFDTARWDNDFDGISNLDEKLQGTFVLNATIESIPYESILSLSYENLSSREMLADWSDGYEEFISNARPYQESVDELEPLSPEVAESFYTSTKRNVDISSQGTGTFSEEYRRLEPGYIERFDRDGIRVGTDDSVSWTGSYYWYGGALLIEYETEFDFRTTKGADETFSHKGSILRRTSGLASSGFFHDINFDLVGGSIDEDGYCSATSGLMSFTDFYSASQDWSGQGVIAFQFVKNASDETWTVQVQHENGFVDNIYVRNADTRFFCNFSDL